MRSNNVMGIVFSNARDEAIPELTGMRTMGSVPFGCRYRLIDFPLSGMVQGGISKVGVITKSNYRSLMDHLGTGKSWDLSRKHEGLVLLPPFVGKHGGGNQTRLEGLHAATEFLSNSKEEFVVMSDCATVCNVDYRQLLRRHQESEADITLLCRQGQVPQAAARVEQDASGRVRALHYSSKAAEPSGCYALGIFVLRKALLQRLLQESEGDDYEALLGAAPRTLRVQAEELHSYAREIDSLQSYYNASLELLRPEVRAEVFVPERPVLTKVQDDMPATYGLHAKVRGSLVADGCKLQGTADGSVLFRNVVLEEGAVVRHCVLMQGTFVGAGARLEHVITDKAVVIKPGKTLVGAENYPIYLGKKIVI